ncbi:hypothetical protein AWM70_10395 [Paenibacillus yonginensis]|uniref:Two-component system response regulator n=1 Tax=Paenibacillus yonginensis TaxID=1462996 RepID=A0A1B1N0K4_9BACL|nr:response regulator [Paenibacillus yonginensis]ANS74957.1 hypothetical protein AWM70_10395 [Paenibacillus yonginensis]
MKLKALLVDDEYPILNNLSKVLKWEELGVEVAGMARNGAEALKFAEEQQIDIILSDIRMPVMDGLSLAKEIRERGMRTEILLLTGYQEFEYARTAIRYGVKDYISKPIHYEMLEQTVDKIARQIRTERGASRRGSQLNSVVNWASEHFITQILSGRGQFLADEDGEEEFLSHPRYSVMLADLEGYAKSSTFWTREERRRFNCRMKKLLKERLPFGDGQTVLQLREGEWFIFYDADSIIQKTREVLYPVYSELQRLARTAGDMEVRILAEKGPFSLNELSGVYHRIQRSLLLTPSEEWLLNGEELKPGLFEAPEETPESQWRWLEQIGSALRGEDENGVRKVIDELRTYLALLDEHAALRAEKMLHYMLIHLLREMRELQLLKDHEEEAVWEELQQPLGLKDLMHLLSELAIRPKGPASSRKPAEQLMMVAGDYIARHLGGDFGIEEVADHLGISCSYFCLLFKNHYGETFVEYVTRQRMEAAKKQLATSEASITQIGQGLGYQERRYFTKVFQKYTGVTPSDYRASVHGVQGSVMKE